MLAGRSSANPAKSIEWGLCDSTEGSTAMDDLEKDFWYKLYRLVHYAPKDISFDRIKELCAEVCAAIEKMERHEQDS